MVGFVARVTVGLKPGVADPEGENTGKALHLLGFDSVRHVAAKKVFEVTIEAPNEAAARSSLEKMCDALLANPVVHTTEIEVKPRAG